MGTALTWSMICHRSWISGTAAWCVSYWAAMKAQVFITCVQQKDVRDAWPADDQQDLAMFHVEHGAISPVATAQ